MKLYYANGACSLAPHIVLEELEIPYDLQRISINSAPPADYLTLNPMGAVPTLLMDNGESLTEVAVIIQYLADQKPEKRLAPELGTLERLRLQELTAYIATEIHKAFTPLWSLEDMTSNESARAEIREFAVDNLISKLGILSDKMGDRDYLLPSGYSVADAYLFTLMNWTFFLKVDLSSLPRILAHYQRVKARPATQRALKAERLI